MSKIKNAAGAAVAVLALGLGVPTATAAPPPPPASSARSVAHPCHASVVYGNGPGKGINSKNYRAYDPWCGDDGRFGDEYWGPWRLKKASAQSDANRHNGLFD